jgi:phosphohistidine phosphatase
MEVLIVRHAPAEDWSAGGDENRPLTQDGIRLFRDAARALARSVPRVNAVYCSPFLRAMQTARILHEEAGWSDPVELRALEPGSDPSEILPVIRKARRARCIVFVGHEPAMSETVSYLLTGSMETLDVEMKKGGAALLEFTGEPRPGKARLRWLLPPGAFSGPPE